MKGDNNTIFDTEGVTMTLSPSQTKNEVFYPETYGDPMAESDPARDYMVYGIEALSNYFQEREDVYVSGNLYIYYSDNSKDFIAPDVFVVFGVSKKKRITYWVREEGKVPGFVLEVTSKTTLKKDQQEKPDIYKAIGVLEYFQYDPTGDYLKPQLQGSRLEKGTYQPITPQVLSGGVVSIKSESLGLDLRLIKGELRFYDPKTQQILLTPSETEQARQQEAQARQQEAQARQKAEKALSNAIAGYLKLGWQIEQIAQQIGLSTDEVRRLRQE